MSCWPYITNEEGCGFGPFEHILEGCARASQTDYLRFLTIAFGSLKELHYQLNLSKRLGFLDSQVSALIEQKVNETEKVMNSLIRALRVKLIQAEGKSQYLYHQPSV